MGDWIIEIVKSFGYIGIALLTLLENAFPPIPSELIMPLAGYQSAQGGMSFWGAVIAGSIGSVVGTLGWYWVGLYVGEKRVRDWTGKHGRWLAVEAEDIDHAQNWFQRHGVWAVFICRMIPGRRTWISLPAGFSAMPMSKLLPPTIVGTFLWTASLTYAGRLLGSSYEEIDKYIGPVSWVVLGSIVVIYVWRQIRFVYKRRTGA